MSQRGRRWTVADVPDQAGRTAVVTGGNTGIGFETAAVLAERGARVVLACSDLRKARSASARIGGPVDVLHIDLASLASVRAAAEELRSRYHRVDLLINNAGLMVPPYGLTEDGFELQFGTNHLGPFAFTGLVLDLLLAVTGSRIVTISSIGHRQGTIHFEDLRSARRYRPMRAYGQSKLANLMFTYELQRRLAAAGAETIAVAAHPGGSSTELSRHMPRPARVLASWPMFAQSAQMGALPTLRAAVDPAVRGGEYYGPDRLFETRGHPVRVRSNARSHDLEVQRRLWRESERLTGVTYRLTPQKLLRPRGSGG